MEAQKEQEFLEHARNCWSDIMEAKEIMKPDSQGKSLHELADEIRAGNTSEEMLEKIEKIMKFLRACSEFHIEVDWNNPIW